MYTSLSCENLFTTKRHYNQSYRFHLYLELSSLLGGKNQQKTIKGQSVSQL